jgi:hypothetical protein
MGIYSPNSSKQDSKVKMMRMMRNIYSYSIILHQSFFRIIHEAANVDLVNLSFFPLKRV